jgi:hypothetical protein
MDEICKEEYVKTLLATDLRVMDTEEGKEEEEEEEEKREQTVGGKRKAGEGRLQRRGWRVWWWG